VRSNPYKEIEEKENEMKNKEKKLKEETDEDGNFYSNPIKIIKTDKSGVGKYMKDDDISKKRKISNVVQEDEIKIVNKKLNNFDFSKW
jgi:hypothetical protein